MRTVLRVLWLPTLVVLVTLGWLWLDRVFGWKGITIPWLGAVLVLGGLALAFWCAALFARIGKGTPLPFTMKTKHLVIAGPYRVVRNPMMFGVGAVLIGIALWIGSLGLWIGFACFVIFVALFVPLFEEPDMERRFGDEYRDYCRSVPRWFPHF